MPFTDLHQTLVQTNIYVLANALCSDITALHNRKQDLVKMWKTISKMAGDKALLLNMHHSFLNNVLLLILKIGSENTTAITPQLKVEALKWMEKVKNKGEKAVGVLKGTMEKRAMELLGAIDQGKDGEDKSDERDRFNSKLDHPAPQLIRKVIACTPPPEDDDDKENEEKETS
ncbi:hypothetical protein C0995_008857 [Termitomyces sp. Mi166|nr:hypothetical protein C0995_008857 [Termitomyces sp. Mi166\